MNMLRSLSMLLVSLPALSGLAADSEQERVAAAGRQTLP